MDIAELVSPNENILIVWTNVSSNPAMLTDKVSAIMARLNENLKEGQPGGNVSLDNSERILMSKRKPGSFNKIFSGHIGLATFRHNADVLAYFLQLLTPNGQLFIAEERGQDELSGVRSSLVLAGFQNIHEPELIPGGEDGRPVYSWRASKPAFEVGASRLLSFAKKPEPKKASLWTLDDMEDDTVELIDENMLVDEQDLLKPDPASLRVCGTTGKRKACKDCSCGLREELAEGKEVKTKSVTSSCGSCYLGDAFRCASCPYLGMPAFKPGEKIQLSDRQLNPDLTPV